MLQIPIFSSRGKIASLASQAVRNYPGGEAFPLPMSKVQETLDFLVYEVPVAVVVDLTEPDGLGAELLEKVFADPWLLQTGVIAVYDERDQIRQFEVISGSNLIIPLRTFELDQKLPTVISILKDNQRILFQRGLGSDLISNLSGSLRMRNDIIEASCYSSIICNLLHSSDVFSLEKKQKLQVALQELLLNAIEHGNCGISFAEKSQWLDSGKAIDDLIKARCENPEIASRSVILEYHIEPNIAHFTVVDEGSGFNWREVLENAISRIDASEYVLHGRGISLVKAITDNLSYNEKGNQVSFDVLYQRPENPSKAGLFRNQGLRVVQPGEIVFRQGEESNFLYYISSGTYEVLVDGKPVSQLCAEDVFVGEMSFLLNRARSAGIRALTVGKLIGISKHQFISGLRQYPHYSLFLARLLAQRINRSNNTQSEL